MKKTNYMTTRGIPHGIMKNQVWHVPLGHSAWVTYHLDVRQCNINLSGKQKGVRWGEIEKEGKRKEKGGKERCAWGERRGNQNRREKKQKRGEK